MGITIKDIAREADVSIWTVSVVLNGKGNVADQTRKRVLQAVRKFNYQPKRLTLSKKNIKTIGLVLPIVELEIETFFNYAIAAVKNTTLEKGHHFILFTQAEVEKELRDGLYFGTSLATCDGFIYFCPYNNWDWSLKVLRSWGVPCALIRRATGVPGVITITDNDYQGTRQVLDHLYQLGHRAIGYAARQSSLGDDQDNRRKSYEDFIREKALDQEQVFMFKARYGFAESDQDEAVRQLEPLVKATLPPTAFCCYDDGVAMQLIACLQKLGIRVPQDMAVTGFDNDKEGALFQPALTTVGIPATEMCTAACRLLFDVMEGITVQKMDVVLEDRLIVRESCGYKEKNAATQAQ
jgi:LacI family transcriptional regulator, repressor for deo operon, udp, cdd, tsx, nupC, and nupG